MLWFAIAAALAVFFYFVLRFCARDYDLEPSTRDWHIAMMRKSPLGRWRY